MADERKLSPYSLFNQIAHVGTKIIEANEKQEEIKSQLQALHAEWDRIGAIGVETIERAGLGAKGVTCWAFDRHGRKREFVASIGIHPRFDDHIINLTEFQSSLSIPPLEPDEPLIEAAHAAVAVRNDNGVITGIDNFDVE